MSCEQHARPGRWWSTYLNALLFLIPPVGTFGFMAVFVLPKVKQICADAGYDPSPYFRMMDFAAENWIWLFCAAVAFFVVMEVWLRAWAKYRRVVVGLLVFLINTSVLVSFACVLVIVGIAGPALLRPH